MKLSTRGRYAVMAIVDLAIHTHGNPVKLREVAKRQNLSLFYLEQLFRHLRKSGIVKSIKGPGGGYLLSRPSSEIRISDIIFSVSEPIRATRCAPLSSSGCTNPKTKCLTHGLWEGLGNQIYLYLSSVSLEDVCKGNRSNYSVVKKQNQIFDTMSQ